EENEIKVALKNLHNSKDMTDEFLKEVIAHGITNSNDFIIQCYGITKDPNTNNNIMVMEFAEGGSLHEDLMLNFDKITWQTKLERLYCIATGTLFSLRENEWYSPQLCF
ncbi:1096_t:CDS:2, partial [Diversispora eburnea]